MAAAAVSIKRFECTSCFLIESMWHMISSQTPPQTHRTIFQLGKGVIQNSYLSPTKTEVLENSCCLCALFSKSTFVRHEGITGIKRIKVWRIEKCKTERGHPGMKWGRYPWRKGSSWVSCLSPSTAQVLQRFYKLDGVKAIQLQPGPSRVTSEAKEVRYMARVFSRVTSREQAIEAAECKEVRHWNTGSS